MTLVIIILITIEQVSLARYRAASREVVEAIKPLAKIIERASIDEVYVDVSDVMVPADAEINAEVAATRTPARFEYSTRCTQSNSAHACRLYTVS